MAFLDDSRAARRSVKAEDGLLLGDKICLTLLFLPLWCLFIFLGLSGVLALPLWSMPAAPTNMAPIDDLVWRDAPHAWHQQAARIVDHRFSTFTAMKSFARDAKKAGVSILMLVSVQKTSKCPGPWYNGLQLCDHINGTYPVEDGHGDPGTLGEWQALAKELRPMRLMWCAARKSGAILWCSRSGRSTSTSVAVARSHFKWSADAPRLAPGCPTSSSPRSRSEVELSLSRQRNLRVRRPRNCSRPPPSPSPRPGTKFYKNLR